MYGTERVSHALSSAFLGYSEQGIRRSTDDLCNVQGTHQTSGTSIILDLAGFRSISQKEGIVRCLWKVVWPPPPQLWSGRGREKVLIYISIGYYLERFTVRWAFFFYSGQRMRLLVWAGDHFFRVKWKAVFRFESVKRQLFILTKTTVDSGFDSRAAGVWLCVFGWLPFFLDLGKKGWGGFYCKGVLSEPIYLVLWLRK